MPCNKSDLSWLYAQWEAWASTAPREEDGWESDFPDWPALMSAASGCMSSDSLDPETLKRVERCWALSEESEELCAFAGAHIEQCWTTVEALASSPDPRVRWQAYAAAAAKGQRAEGLLRRGLADPDPYCRRRAILALGSLAPNDAEDLTKRFIADGDPYIRQASIELARSSSDAAFRQWVLDELSRDPVEHVRKAAQQRLRSS